MLRHDEKQIPLVVHIVYSFKVGGMENGMVNIINGMDRSRYRHAVICLADYSEFRDKIIRDDVEFYALNKRAGNDLSVHRRLYKLLRKLRPDIVHTRNFSTIEMQPIAALAGVKKRIHGEHGRDQSDISGGNKKYRFIRRSLSLFIQHYIVVSKDIQQWLNNTIGVTDDKITQIYNGVDYQRFIPAAKEVSELRAQLGWHDKFIFGTVGRMQPEKAPQNLIKAFALMIQCSPELRERARLVMVGDGVLREECERIVRESGIEELVWFAGLRDDIPDILQMLDVFVLPSLIEGISNTILESMASGLPVIATDVGGNSELVVHQRSGILVAAEDDQAAAEAMRSYLDTPGLAYEQGVEGRKIIESTFSIPRMVSRYTETYDRL